MSKSLRDERDRRISELQALVTGLSGEISRLNQSFAECQKRLGELTVLIKRIENRQKRQGKTLKSLLNGD